MFDLHNKTALITGASRGLGFSAAQMLHERGAKVILHGTNEEKLKEASAKLGGAPYVMANLLEGDAAEKLAEKALEAAGGHIDILVNNAGITRDALFIRQTQDDWNQVLFVNLEQIVRLTRHLLPLMQKQGWGRIINITSIVAHMGNVGQTNYITAKAGLTGFTKALAKEAARKGVTVNAIAPGFITTDMTDKIPEAIKESFIKQIPAQRFGDAKDIAAAITFLASEEASYITGTTLHINGGLYTS
ncbi:MAG: beta-ketoacyl-ACP reductase [Alphaproteobacteria bacterium CG_4_10_14_0_8_um_filter_53_9]|nr:MAG: beta-ketoacyl-ACP reductase [Alphaproteobacteria bacterium CG_4_10_14_0_8_um_filter_53_9]